MKMVKRSSLLCSPLSTGYANEVGEAFRALVPVSLVWGSYAVATAYVTADAVDKGKKAAVVRYDHLTVVFLGFVDDALKVFWCIFKKIL